MQFYTDPTRENDKWALPDAEVFYDDADDAGNGPRNFDSEGNPVEPGYYWWICFPGCLPESDAHGPFPTQEAAINSARVYFED